MRDAAEGDESAASAIALTPVSAGATGVSYAWCLCAGARGGLPPFPARLVVFAAATCFSPLPGFFARAGGWTRTRFAGGGLWKRSGTFALRFRRPPSGAAARGGVAAGVAMADMTSYALRAFGDPVGQSDSDLARGAARLDSSGRRVERARVERSTGTSIRCRRKGRWTCVRRVGARAARRVTVRSCVAVWSCPRISNCQGVFLNLFIPSFSDCQRSGGRRLRRPLPPASPSTGTRFPVTSRRAATRSRAVGTADAALGPRSSPARSAFETRSW